MRRKRRRINRIETIKIKLIKCNKEDIQAIDKYHDIDVELAIIIKSFLSSKIRKSKINDFYIDSDNDLIKNKNIVARYNKKYGSQFREVLICMFRISKDYIQENIICNGKMKTNYYKIVRGGF